MLWLALPGIDPVDLHKTGRTLMFYTLVFYTVPLFDARKFKGKESKQVTEYDDDAQRATMKFEEFCPQFLDRVLLVIQQQEGYSEKNAVDRGTLYVIQRCVRAFFSTLSKNLSSVCVKHVAKKITGSDFWKVSKYAGNVLSSIGLTNNTEGLGVLFPVLYSRLVEESQTKRVTPEKDGEDEEKPYEEGGRFYYKRDGVAGSEATHCLYLLSQLPKQSGEEVIKYLTQIRAVYGIFKDSKSAGNRKYATRLIRSVLRTLTRVYPKEYRGQDALKFSDPNWAHWQEWGGVEDKNKLDIEYHVPTEKEVKHAAELCQLVLTPAMAVLDSGNKGKSEDVNNALLEISAILRGANSILGEFEGALVNKTDEKSLPTPTQPLDLGFKLRIDSKSGKIAHRPAGAKEEAGWESLRGYLAAKLSSAVTRLTGGSEDTASARKKRKVDSNGSKSAAKKTTTASGNVKVLTTLAECLGSVLNLWLINKSKLDRAFREKDQSRKSRKDWWSTKTCSLRVLLLERAYYLHLLRDEYATRLSRRYTLTVHRAIQSLVTLVLNDFEKVRSAAQQGLHATVERYPESATFCLTTLLTTVRSRYSSKEEMIGALGMLSSREVLRAACTNFSNAQALLKGLFDGGCESHEEDKVQQATHPLFMTLIQMLRAPVSPTDASSNLSKAYVDDFTKATKYLTSLLSDSKKKMHWRYELVATALLLELTLTSGVLTVDIVMVFARALTSDIFALRQFAIHAFNALLSARHVYSIPDHPKPSETTATPGESKGEDPKDLKEIQDEKEWQSASLQEIFGGGYMKPEPQPSSLSMSEEVKKALGSHLDANFEKILTSLEENHPSLSPSGGNKKGVSTALLNAVIARLPHVHLSCLAHNGIHGSALATAHVRLLVSIFIEYPKLMERVAKVLESLVKSEEKEKQCLAAEIVSAGVEFALTGKLDRYKQVKSFVLPALQAVLKTGNHDTIGMWRDAIKTSVYAAKATPRKIAFVLKALAEAPFSQLQTNAASTSETFRPLCLLRAAIETTTWRGLDVGLWSIKKLKDNGLLSHPFKQVRSEVGNILAAVTRSAFRPGVTESNTVLKELVQTFAERLQSLMTAKASGAKEGAEAKGREVVSLANVAVQWMIPCAYYSQTAYFGDLLFPLLPAVLHLQQNSDAEAAGRAKFCIGAWSWGAWSLAPSEEQSAVNKVVVLLRKMSKSDNWHVRKSVTKFLTILVPRHALIICPGEVKENPPPSLKTVKSTLVNLLSDSQVEVREGAGSALQAMLRSTPGSGGSAGGMSKMSSKMQRKLYKMSKTTIPSYSKDEKQQAMRALAINKRHGGVLGLSAFILSQPYDVPEWLPHTLIGLAENTRDAVPIGTSAKKVFQEFMRTHQDEWHVFEDRFTEDQLDTLRDCGSSLTYFA
mmetsp:Transcript_7622/g.11786  ORF Transcript_7622/g.11786 Transcript_7622/m.11786 type:complete len:1399 (-) Transcript_7622:80-4276(-)